MTSIFEVSYRETTDNDSGSAEGKEATVAAPNAEAAIAKLKKATIGVSWKWDDDDGKKRTSKITAVEIRGVRHITDVDHA